MGKTQYIVYNSKEKIMNNYAKDIQKIFLPTKEKIFLNGHFLWHGTYNIV